MKTFYLIAGLFFLESCRAQKINKIPVNKDNNTLLWEISGKGLIKSSYLYGTFHVLCKEDIHFSQNLIEAITKSQEVYFEMDMDDPSTVFGGMFFMKMKNGKNLKEIYTKEEYQKVSNFFSDSLKMNLNSFSNMKPMLLEIMLYPFMMPCKNQSGVETELINIAKKKQKEIRGLETIEFQSSLLDSIPYDVQAKALLRDIDSTEQFKLYLGKMVKAYKRQETDKLIEMINDTAFSGGENDDMFLTNRNIKWIKQLNEILKQKNIFIGVGAAHLFGKDGLIRLLSDEGYIVRPLQNN